MTNHFLLDYYYRDVTFFSILKTTSWYAFLIVAAMWVCAMMPIFMSILFPVKHEKKDSGYSDCG